MTTGNFDIVTLILSLKYSTNYLLISYVIDLETLPHDIAKYICLITIQIELESTIKNFDTSKMICIFKSNSLCAEDKRFVF